MRITKGNGFVQLTYLPNLFPVNCYLVEEDDGFTLVDAALPNNAKAILHAADQLGKPIKRIVLTHAHDDHVGALDAIKASNGTIDVYISERDSRLLAGDRSLAAGEPQTPIRGGVPKAVKTRPDVLLQDGDKIGSLLAIAAGGHTPGSMAFLDERTGLLIAGDAFHTRGGVTVTSRMRWSFPFPALATWNAEASLASAKRLADRKPAILAAGHGNLLEHPVDAMLAAIADAEQTWIRKGKGA
ncbi:MBL fold metallo-hydrolase [Paenibacillus sp. PAMC21692]|uniref:MBL fold metallo-hydrolase n=1 Tax=Paenibacillus sp. PAMC21692 TaxID=2762320 RepID=UPI00164E1668|nr:MBL fold metallo-hydrolase [Paenibacillus sp. PAMC21692]QNK56212.1 MBL fold metallo-hydrolase [Paenibacillus sp. PAMC21692]